MSKKMVDMFIALIDSGNFSYADFTSKDLTDAEKTYILEYMRDKMMPEGVKAPTPQDTALMNMKMMMHVGTGRRKQKVHESRNTDSSQ